MRSQEDEQNGICGLIEGRRGAPVATLARFNGVNITFQRPRIDMLNVKRDPIFFLPSSEKNEGRA